MVWLKQVPCDDILGIETEMLFVELRPCNNEKLIVLSCDLSDYDNIP